MKNILLKSRPVLLCAAFLLSSLYILQAQSLSEKLGGTTTQFSFFTKDSSMNVEQQIIIKRSVSEKLVEVDREGYYGLAYGLGYESYHLEFVAKKPIKYVKNIIVAKKRTKSFYYFLQFYDAEKKLIAEKKMPLDQIKKTLINEKDQNHTYSINLKSIPMLVLDQTKEINIIQYEIITIKEKPKQR